MHHCLLVPEIVANIAAECNDATYMTETSSLFAMATTCRAFHESALDALYRDLWSIGPLIKCLPRDLWEEEREPRKRLVRIQFDTLILTDSGQ